MYFIKLLSKLVVSDKPYNSMTTADSAFLERKKKKTVQATLPAQLKFVQCTQQFPAGVLKKMM